jgi:hypothetical protein
MEIIGKGEGFTTLAPIEKWDGEVRGTLALGDQFDNFI